MRLHEIYLDHSYVHLVTDLLEGGEVRPNTGEKFSEARVSKIVKQSLQAITYLHGLNIVHRDLKTENMLFASKNKKIVKLIDFGYSKFCVKKADLNETKGTPYYISPEVLQGHYDERTDLWSIGVVTYYLLSGKFPFMAPDDERLAQKIMACDYNFEGECWAGVSREARKFIERLIEPNVERRMTCEQALSHAWIRTSQNALSDE